MDPARFDPAQPHAIQEVVRYRPWSAFFRVFMTALLAPILGLVLGMTFLGTRTVTVDASRATGLLVVARYHPLSGTRRQVFALAGLRGTALFRSRDKHGRDTYSLALVTDSGRERISILGAGPERLAQQRRLDQFLADPGAPPLHLVYDQPRLQNLFVLLFVPILLGILRGFWLRAAIRVEAWRDTVLVERGRWPLGREVLTLRRGDVARAYVQERPGRRQTNARLALALTSGETVPVLTSWGGDRRLVEAAAGRINGVLGIRAGG